MDNEKKAAICPVCNGTGEVGSKADPAICARCKGSGAIVKTTDEKEPQLLLD